MIPTGQADQQNNLALALGNQGRWKEAEELNVQVMEARKKLLGLEHLSTLSSMDNFAPTFWNQGQWKEPEELNIEVMETRKRIQVLEVQPYCVCITHQRWR